MKILCFTLLLIRRLSYCPVNIFASTLVFLTACALERHPVTELTNINAIWVPTTLLFINVIMMLYLKSIRYDIFSRIRQKSSVISMSSSNSLAQSQIRREHMLMRQTVAITVGLSFYEVGSLLMRTFPDTYNSLPQEVRDSTFYFRLETICAINFIVYYLGSPSTLKMLKKMLTTNWQADVVICEIFIFMPIYTVVLSAICFMRPRKASFRTHYYTLVLSQGAADFLTVTIFITQMLPRYFQIGNSLIWWLDTYGASNFYVNSGPQMFILRSIGLFLITMQRYATICRPHGRLSHILSVTPSYTLILCHWIISLLIHLPAELVCHAHFENPVSFFVITTEEHKRTSAAIVICTFIFCGLSTMFMYSGIIRILCSARRTSVMSTSSWQTRQNTYQEARLCIHVFFLCLMSAATFSYYVFQALYSNELGVGDVVISDMKSSNDSISLQQENLRALRLWYPLVSGNMSFINPLMLLLLNRDIQKCFVNFCKGKKMNNTSSILAMNRTL